MNAEPMIILFFAFFVTYIIIYLSQSFMKGLKNK
jgi:hypothetical protein